MILLSPGSAIAIRDWWGEHWGVFARNCWGHPTVISNRGVKGGVTEELWEVVVGAANWRIVGEVAPALSTYMVIDRARSRIGDRYDFWSWNCQDFVYWALGLEPQSPQRNAVVGILTIAAIGTIIKLTGKGR